MMPELGHLTEKPHCGAGGKEGMENEELGN